MAIAKRYFFIREINILYKDVKEGQGMYDMHCHILPEVDDGASSLEEAVEMVIMAKENGINAIFATPHYIEGEEYKDYSYNSVILERLNNELSSIGIDIKIYIGCEVHLTPNILELLDKGQIGTLNNSHYLLIELPMFDIPIYTETMIYDLKLKGITPIIAHPERNTKIMENPNILYELIKKGALTQISLPSLLDLYGRDVRKAAEILLKQDMIHFAGTDAHSASRKYYRVAEAVGRLKELIGEEKSLKILKYNPQAVIKGSNIKIPEPSLYRREGKIKKFLSSLI